MRQGRPSSSRGRGGREGVQLVWKTGRSRVRGGRGAYHREASAASVRQGREGKEREGGRCSRRSGRGTQARQGAAGCRGRGGEAGRDLRELRRLVRRGARAGGGGGGEKNLWWRLVRGPTRPAQRQAQSEFESVYEKILRLALSPQTQFGGGRGVIETGHTKRGAPRPRRPRHSGRPPHRLGVAVRPRDRSSRGSPSQAPEGLGDRVKCRK